MEMFYLDNQSRRTLTLLTWLTQLLDTYTRHKLLIGKVTIFSYRDFCGLSRTIAKCNAIGVPQQSWTNLDRLVPLLNIV